MEVELMVTKRDDDNRRPTDRQGEYRAICSRRWNGRVLQKETMKKTKTMKIKMRTKRPENTSK